MTHYALRAEQENDFEQWKSQMPCDRERNSSEGGKAGATFIQFVGKQLLICQEMGFPVPEGCGRTYQVDESRT